VDRRGLLLSGAVSATFAALGMVAVLRRRRMRAYLMFRRAVLVSLLVTQVFVFRIEEWSAVTGLVIDLIVLGLIAAELQQMERAVAVEPLR
jgi:NADH:ubiquinone oxidoreductase subunit K